jgi:hypothetical protein
LSLKEGLQVYLQQIARERAPYLAPRGNFLAQKYIHQPSTIWGSVEIHTFEVASQSGNNIIVELPGQVKNKKQIYPLL